MTFPSALDVLKKQSLPSLVQEELERMILDDRLLPGEQMREVALAALLDVSARPDSRSLPRLGGKGLVTVVKNCGVYTYLSTWRKLTRFTKCASCWKD